MTQAALPPKRRLWQEPSFRFVAFLLLYLVGFGVIYNEVLRLHPEVMNALSRLAASATYGVMRIATSEVTLEGSLVSYGGFTVRIIPECVGALEILIFVACVLAYPARPKDKGLGLLLGVPAIYAFNVLRILCLLVVGRHLPAAFDFFHLYFWQATLILMITSLFLLWLYFVVRRS